MDRRRPGKTSIPWRPTTDIRDCGNSKILGRTPASLELNPLQNSVSLVHGVNLANDVFIRSDVDGPIQDRLRRTVAGLIELGGAGVGSGVGAGVGSGFRAAVSAGVGTGAGLGVCACVGASVGVSVVQPLAWGGCGNTRAMAWDMVLAWCGFVVGAGVGSGVGLPVDFRVGSAWALPWVGWRGAWRGRSRKFSRVKGVGAGRALLEGECGLCRETGLGTSMGWKSGGWASPSEGQ